MWNNPENLPAMAIGAAVAVPAAAYIIERTVVLGLNVGDKLWQRVYWGPSTDPETWPSWEDADLEKPGSTWHKQMEAKARAEYERVESMKADGMDALHPHEMVEAMIEVWPESAEPLK